MLVLMKAGVILKVEKGWLLRREQGARQEKGKGRGLGFGSYIFNIVVGLNLIRSSWSLASSTR